MLCITFDYRTSITLIVLWTSGPLQLSHAAGMAVATGLLTCWVKLYDGKIGIR